MANKLNKRVNNIYLYNDKPTMLNLIEFDNQSYRKHFATLFNPIFDYNASKIKMAHNI